MVLRKLSLILVGLLFTSAALAVQTSAEYAHIIDYDTGEILLSKNSDEHMFPSSMAKLMTAYVVFSKLKEGSLSMDDTFEVSEKAWRKGGSKMFIEVGKNIKVQDLLRGMIIQSGNDASIALAEGIAGTEEGFADEMNRAAKKLGMTNSHFTNATGWPDPELYTTPRDLATLAWHLVHDFPEYYSFYAEESFKFNNIQQRNRNPLLYKNVGADGLKTGHTDLAGYGLTASAEQDGRRVIMVVNGLDSSKDRAEESTRLVEWSFRNFENIKLFDEGQVITKAPTWLGEYPSVPLAVNEGAKITVSKRNKRNLTFKAAYNEPIQTPVEKGKIVGKLIVTAEDTDYEREFDLVAAEDVDQLGAFGRMKAYVSYLLWGASAGNDS